MLKLTNFVVTLSLFFISFVYAQRPIQHSDKLIVMGDGSTVAVPEFVNLIRQVNGVNYTSEDDVYYDTGLTTELWYATGHDRVHGAMYEPAGTDYDTEYANFLLTLAEAGIAGIYIRLTREQVQARIQQNMKTRRRTRC